MHQHRAREDELFNLELLKMLQETLGAAHGDLFIKRARFTREIVVGGEMNNGRDSVSVGDPDPLESTLYANF